MEDSDSLSLGLGEEHTSHLSDSDSSKHDETSSGNDSEDS